MNQFNGLRRALLLLSIAFLGACASGVKLDDVADSQNTSGSDGKASVRDLSGEPWNDPKNPLYKRSIYFDFDSYVVKPEYQSTLQAHANYLKANKSRSIKIEGNTDERGTAEYNLALGQKRADAVRQSLNLLGVSTSQVETVSFGEEKPAVQGTDEAAYSKNRRAEFFYK